MMQPTVSVVITTYNYGRFIAGAIESVLGQTRRPDDIIVVDDGSTDDTAAQVAAYAGQGVRYIYQANRGPGAARNTGILTGRSDLIAFLDADDRWLPDKLARQMAHLHAHPTAGLVTGSEWQVYETGQPPLYLRRPPVGAARLYPQILIENSVGNPSLVLVRRACFDRVGLFDESIPLGQDWDMWIRIARAFPVGVVDAALITFTRHTTSITAGKVWERYRANQAFHRRYISQVESLPVRLWLRRGAYGMTCYYAAAELVDDPAQRPAALATALAAALLDPFHEPVNKAGVLVRALFGRAAFAAVRNWLPHHAPPPPEPDRLAPHP
jgi:glycosyltransferase involved in cell wall biosynthesis